MRDSRSLNPFTLGIISSDQEFCNREKEIEELTRHALNCTHVVIFSPRRYGKTSLVKRVMARVSSQGYLAVYVDCFSVIAREDLVQKFASAVIASMGKNVIEGDFLRKTVKLFKRIVPSLDIKPDGVSISAKYDQSTGFPYLIEDIFSGVARHLRSKKTKCLIVFDEFQEISELKESKQVEGLLREQVQALSDMGCFFVGSRRRILRSMFNDRKRPFFKLAFNYPLEKISREELANHIVKLFAKTRKACSLTLAGDLYDHVEGNTYYVRKLSHLLWDMTEKEVTSDLLSAAKAELLEAEGLDLQGVFAGLLMGEKKLAMALAKEPTGKPYAMDYLKKHNLSPGGLQKSMKSLQGKDIVEPDLEGIYRLTDPLFGRWCRAQGMI
jgi:Cdc6-like AAA superfamily ATPase